MTSFHLAGAPQPMPVRDPNSGLVVDGYRLTIVSNETGAKAILEIPVSDYNVAEVTRRGEELLGHQDAVIATFGTTPPPKE